MTYDELQVEQAVWAAHRFGSERTPQKALEPFAGVAEEFGELVEAEQRGDANAIEDAIGDAVIYLADVCTRMNWPLLGPGVDTSVGVLDEQIALGKLAHAVLKTAQGIRRDEDHNANGQNAVALLLYHLDERAAYWHLGDALTCAISTWSEVVSKRGAGHAAIPKGAA